MSPQEFELVNLWINLENRLSALLGLYFAINLAVIGWVVSLQKELSKPGKVFIVIAYTLFAILVISDLYNSFKVAKDLDDLLSCTWPTGVSYGLSNIPKREPIAWIMYTLGIVVVYAIICVPRQTLERLLEQLIAYLEKGPKFVS